MEGSINSSEEVVEVEQNKRWQKSYFDVLGLCCSSEVPLIENILRGMDGVKHVSVIVPSRTVIVLHDQLVVSQLKIVKALNEARMEANVRLYGETGYKRKWPSPYTIACGVLLALSLFKYIYRPFQWLALGAVAVGIFPILWKSIASVRNWTLDINILALIAVGGTIYLKDYTEAGTIVFLFTIAQWLESMASHKATSVMSSLMNMTPQKAIIAETGDVVDVDDVKVSTVLAVKAGEVIPIDGIVTHGTSEVDEKTLTGESYPVPKQMDSTVWAGTINLNGYISVTTTAKAEDCVVAKMAKLVEEAQNSKSKTQRFIDRCAKYYTPAVLCTALGLAIIPAVLRLPNKNNWFQLALVVLVSACPCALILSTPVATFCALSQAAKCGILVKGGDYLELLSKIKNMAFDKTGTITTGDFVVTEFRSLEDDDSNLDTLLYWISSIESKSSHPMASALIEYGRSKKIEPGPQYVEEYENYPGEGIHGKIDGEHIYVGNRRIGIRAGCQTVPTLEEVDKVGKTIGYVYQGVNPVGIFTLSDTCRSGVIEAIKELKLLGVKTAMLTGDSHSAAMHAQEQLGNSLEQVYAELLPEEKAEIIKECKRKGPTAMIGDGINDAPALAAADIGISMGVAGSALAIETGHVILMSNDIRKIPKLIKLARRTQRKVIQNVILSITTKAAIIALAFAGHPLVWAAVLTDVGTCLLVIFNSMFLLGGETHKHKGVKSSKSSINSAFHKRGCHSHDHSFHETAGKLHDHSCHETASKPLDHACHETTSKPYHHACLETTKEPHHHSCYQTTSEPKECSSNICSPVERSLKSCESVDKICPDKTENKEKCKNEGLDLHSHGCKGFNHTTSSVQEESYSGHNHLKHEHVSSEEAGSDVHCHCEKEHARGDKVGHHDKKDETNNIRREHKLSIDTVSAHSCGGFPDLEKREIGRCCKSYRKECCSKKHSRFASSLSEIRIE